MRYWNIVKNVSRTLRTKYTTRILTGMSMDWILSTGNNKKLSSSWWSKNPGTSPETAPRVLVEWSSLGNSMTGWRWLQIWFFKSALSNEIRLSVHLARLLKSECPVRKLKKVQLYMLLRITHQWLENGDYKYDFWDLLSLLRKIRQSVLLIQAWKGECSIRAFFIVWLWISTLASDLGGWAWYLSEK